MPNTVFMVTIQRRNSPAAQLRFEKEDDAAKFINDIETQLTNKDGFIKFNRNGVYAKLRIDSIEVFGYEPKSEYTDEEMKAMHGELNRGQAIGGSNTRCSVLGTW